MNSFSSLYYLAFVKEKTEEGCFFDGDCTAELSLHLFVLFITFICFNAVEIGAPLILKWKAEAEQDSAEKSELETQADMSKSEIMEDYLELMATYGYLTLFAASLTLAPALALLTVAIEGKVDAYKYTRLV